MTIHPCSDEHGKAVTIQQPHNPSPLSAWEDPLAVATVVPAGLMPATVNGVPLSVPWVSPPERSGWERLAEGMDFKEPPFEPNGLKPAAGAVVVEPDGRLWLVSPTNGFGGYKTTFPKGKANDLGLKATALKEVFEESGLQVELFDHLIDVDRSTSRTRYYLARRKGGNPAQMGWESQSVHLVPLERAKDMLNQEVDHAIIEALLDRWSEWVWWFKYSTFNGPEWDMVRKRLQPACRRHWVNLPMPMKHVRLPLDVRLNRQEAENLKLGFVPNEMEEHWFAFYEDGILYEHRSWTGFCMTQVHFHPDGDGLRATHAEVNREPRQYTNIDDDEDMALIEKRIRQLAHMTPEDCRGKDPFAAGLKAAMEPNYLGDPKVVQGLLETYFQVLLDHLQAQRSGEDTNPTWVAYMDQNKTLARIFSGEDPEYAPIGTWNTPEQLGALAVKTLDLDVDYFADENLACILSEGLAGVGLAVRAMVTAFEAQPDGDFERDLLPHLGELIHFTASVLMGTNAVVFHGRTLKDFKYAPPVPKPSQPSLFDLDPATIEAALEKPPDDLRELRKAFGLPTDEDEDEDEGEDEDDLPPNKLGRPIKLPGPIGMLAKKVGGVALLADALGVAPRTLRRWANVGVIPKPGLKLLALQFEKQQVDPGGLAVPKAKE